MAPPSLKAIRTSRLLSCTLQQLQLQGRRKEGMNTSDRANHHHHHHHLFCMSQSIKAYRSVKYKNIVTHWLPQDTTVSLTWHHKNKNKL
jgi:hypothetical protein